VKRASWLFQTRANDRIYTGYDDEQALVWLSFSSATVVAARAQVGICGGHTLRWYLDSLLLFWVDSSGSDI
jgi:hypothetical protein